MIKYFLISVSHIMYFLRFWSCYGFFIFYFYKDWRCYGFFPSFCGVRGDLFSYLGNQGDFFHTSGRIFFNFWGARGFFFFFFEDF
jgi:hypothetical protein